MRYQAPTVRRGFTLVEMLAVLCIFVLALLIVLPGMAQIFNAGADSQAHNLLSAQLVSARALAIQRSTYAAVHVQRAENTANPLYDGVFFSAILVLQNVGTAQTPQMRFVLADGYFPTRLPEGIAFGEISADFVQGDTNGDGLDDFVAMDNNQLADFTSFTLVFSPNGTVVRHVNGENARFYDQSPLFVASNLWDLAVADNEAPITAVAVFRYHELLALSASGRSTFLSHTATFIPINVYTGQLFPRR